MYTRILAIVLGSAIIPFAMMGAASAATPSSTIPKSVFKTERLDAEAQVLKTSNADVQAAITNKTLEQLVTAAGLTRTTFRQDVKTQLVTDLEALGYTQAEITSLPTGQHGHFGQYKGTHKAWSHNAGTYSDWHHNKN